MYGVCVCLLCICVCGVWVDACVWNLCVCVCVCVCVCEGVQGCTCVSVCVMCVRYKNHQGMMCCSPSAFQRFLPVFCRDLSWCPNKTTGPLKPVVVPSFVTGGTTTGLDQTRRERRGHLFKLFQIIQNFFYIIFIIMYISATFTRDRTLLLINATSSYFKFVHQLMICSYVKRYIHKF